MAKLLTRSQSVYSNSYEVTVSPSAFLTIRFIIHRLSQLHFNTEVIQRISLNGLDSIRSMYVSFLWQIWFASQTKQTACHDRVRSVLSRIPVPPDSNLVWNCDVGASVRNSARRNTRPSSHTGRDLLTPNGMHHSANDSNANVNISWTSRRRWSVLMFGIPVAVLMAS